jgi:hypothetical protein
MHDGPQVPTKRGEGRPMKPRRTIGGADRPPCRHGRSLEFCRWATTAHRAVSGLIPCSVPECGRSNRADGVSAVTPRRGPISAGSAVREPGRLRLHALPRDPRHTRLGRRHALVSPPTRPLASLLCQRLFNHAHWRARRQTPALDRSARPSAYHARARWGRRAA